MPKTLLVTGSSGLIGSEVCTYFARELGYTVHGVDNNQQRLARVSEAYHGCVLANQSQHPKQVTAHRTLFARGSGSDSAQPSP